MIKRYLQFIKEGKSINTIMNVDIQPEYEKYASKNGFEFHSWVNYINDSYEKSNEIVFLYNGHDTLGMVTEYDYKDWLLNIGISEDVIDNSTFYDKGYAFFRYCIDSNIDENSIANLVRFMHQNNITDSRDINSKFWKKFRKEYPDDDYSTGELRELLEDSSDMISIPDLMDFIKNYSNIVLLGGGINECLKEVEIALMALNKEYTIEEDFTY
jgi:hypothetical protein